MKGDIETDGSMWVDKPINGITEIFIGKDFVEVKATVHKDVWLKWTERMSKYNLSQGIEGFKFTDSHSKALYPYIGWVSESVSTVKNPSIGERMLELGNKKP